jgi:hypothetical protein
VLCVLLDTFITVKRWYKWYPQWYQGMCGKTQHCNQYKKQDPYGSKMWRRKEMAGHNSSIVNTASPSQTLYYMTTVNWAVSAAHIAHGLLGLWPLHKTRKVNFITQRIFKVLIHFVTMQLSNQFACMSRLAKFSSEIFSVFSILDDTAVTRPCDYSIDYVLENISTNTVELGYNVMKGTEYFVSL